MKDPIGLTVPTSDGDATVTKRLPMSGTVDTWSTYYQGVLADGKSVYLHENLVHSVADGTYQAPAPKGPRKVRTKKERGLTHVETFKRAKMSRGEIIKALSKKLRVSRSTAQTYYYAVK